MANHEIQSRKNLTFEQAEGVESLPTQLLLKEITKELRAKVWRVISHSLSQHRISDRDLLYPKYFVGGPWFQILYDKHVERDFGMADEFVSNFGHQSDLVKDIITGGDYVKLFGFLQFVMRHRECPYGLPAA